MTEQEIRFIYWGHGLGYNAGEIAGTKAATAAMDFLAEENQCIKNDIEAYKLAVRHRDSVVAELTSEVDYLKTMPRNIEYELRLEIERKQKHIEELQGQNARLLSTIESLHGTITDPIAKRQLFVK